MYCPILTAVLVATTFFAEPEEPQRKSDPSPSSLATLAGEYFFSNGFSGERLSISPLGTFKLTYHSCTAESHTYGRARVVNGHVVLRTYLVCRVLFPYAPKELIPIRWGERLYLIPENKGRSFCNYVNVEGGAPGWPPDPCFVRDGDDEKPVEGPPTVPKEWESMLLPAPINGKVVELIGHSRARVDFGYKNGAWKGMPLWVTCEGLPWVQTVAVHATNCIIETDHPDTVFKIGDKVSSKRSRIDRPKPAPVDFTPSPPPDRR